jgi:trigger factor
MQVTVEDVNAVKKILHINVPEEEVSSELDTAFLNLKKNAKVKGFRPGKVPRNVLERMFGKEIRFEVQKKLVQDSFVEALKETDLKVVGQPEIDSPDLEPEKSYQFDVTVELKPEIGTIDFEGLLLKKSIYNVTEEEIEAQLQMLQKRLAGKEDIPDVRPVEEGDFVLLNYEGFQDGKPFDPAPKVENATMKIGLGTILKGFDDEIVGMEKDQEKTFCIQFPDDYFNQELAGREIEYKVRLKAIQKEILPEINDDMAKNLGNFDSLKALRAEIEKHLTEGYAKRVEQELHEQIFEALIEKTDFEIPHQMVQYELEGILDDAQRSFETSNLTMEQVGQTREKLAEQYRDLAEAQVRRHLILDAIIQQNNLAISEEELSDELNEMATTFQQPVEAIKAFYQQQPDKLEYFKHAVLEKKAIKLILEKSEITEEPVESESVSDSDDPVE